MDTALKEATHLLWGNFICVFCVCMQMRVHEDLLNSKDALIFWIRTIEAHAQLACDKADRLHRFNRIARLVDAW